MTPVPIPLCRKWHAFLTIAVPHLALCLNISLALRCEPALHPSPVAVSNPQPSTVAALYRPEPTLAASHPNTRLYHGILGLTTVLIGADYTNTMYWSARLSQSLKLEGVCLVKGVPRGGVYLL